MENRKSRMQQMEENAEVVKGILLDNVNKLNERKEKLEDLEDRSEKLLEASKRFEKTTSKLKQQCSPKDKKNRLKNKTKIIFNVVGVVVAIVVLRLVIYATV